MHPNCAVCRVKLVNNDNIVRWYDGQTHFYVCRPCSRDVNLLIDQTQCTPRMAISALICESSDLVNAIQYIDYNTQR